MTSGPASVGREGTRCGPQALVAARTTNGAGGCEIRRARASDDEAPADPPTSEPIRGADARSRVRALLQVSIAAALLAALVQRVGLVEVRNGLRALRPESMLLPVGLIALDTLVRSENWRRLLGLHGADVRYATVLEAHLVGTFLGAFVPSSVGTDVGRIWALNRRGRVPGVAAIASLLGLNLVNLLAVCVLASVAALCLSGGAWLHELRLLVLAFAAAYAGGLALALSPLSPLPRLRALLPASGVAGRVSGKLAEVAEEIHALRDHPRTLVGVLLLAFLNQLVMVGMAFASGRAVGADVGLLAYLMAVPLLTLGRLVPMSVAGLGGDQAVFVALFKAVGVPAARSLVISLVMAAVNGLHIVASGLVTLVTMAGGLRRNRAGGERGARP